MPEQPLYALTISQPWASLIADGVKLLENRTWSTHYRGPLAIHAGKGTQFLTRSELKAYPTGAIVAIAQLVDVVHVSEIHDGSYPIAAEQQEHAQGPFCWVLRDIQKLDTPAPCSGMLGLWVVRPEILEI